MLVMFSILSRNRDACTKEFLIFDRGESEEKNLGGRPTVSQPVKKLPRPRVSFAAKEQYQSETGEQELGPFPAWLDEKLAALRRLEEQCVNKPGGELREHYLNGCLLS